MIRGEKISLSITNKIIHIAAISKHRDRDDLNIYEEYVTVELFEDIDMVGREIKWSMN